MVLILLGGTLRILNFPGAIFFMFLGIPAPFVVFLPVFLFHAKKVNWVSTSTLVSLLFFMIYLAVVSSMLSLNVTRVVVKEHTTAIQCLVKNSEYCRRQVSYSLDQMHNTADSSRQKSCIQLVKLSDNLVSELRGVEYSLYGVHPQEGETEEFFDHLDDVPRLDSWVRDGRFSGIFIDRVDENYQKFFQYVFKLKHSCADTLGCCQELHLDMGTLEGKRIFEAALALESAINNVRTWELLVLRTCGLRGKSSQKPSMENSKTRLLGNLSNENRARS
jgi:hypothetical protein